MMRVRFVKSFRTYSRGQVVELGGGEANVLLARKIVVPDERPLLVETATAEPEARTADITPQRRRRGR
jgi:hypothetical protein